MIPRLVFFLLLLCHPRICGATGYVYDYNAGCSKAYREYMALHTAEANAVINTEQRNNPANLMAVYVADYEDCTWLLMNCNKADLEQRSGHMDTRLALLDKGDPTSPWFRFCKAGLYLHWAIIHTRFGEQYKAALYFRRSFALLEENKRLFPAFEYNQVFLGLEEAVVGAMPGNYKWLAAIFGMHGDIKKGTGELAAFISRHSPDQPLYAETVLYYSFTRFYLLSEQQEAWGFLTSGQFDAGSNLLNAFVKVVIAMDYHKADAAIATLQVAAADHHYKDYPIFDYQHGLALLTTADTGCIYYFRKYLAETKSDIYIKDSWQKMAFAWYVNNNNDKARYCIGQVRTNGTTRLDADRQASRFAENTTWPLSTLLRARLLIDGGYNDKALAILQNINPATLTNPADQAEYYFRMGRANEEMARNNSQYFQPALQYYRSATSIGKERHEQFAARAALQMGRMYEQLGMSTEAVNKYDECLNMPAHDFQNSIDQQAKAGLNRIGGK